MTHGGNSLLKWFKHKKVGDNKIEFACKMLRQIIRALKKLHKLGYSHGDLKPANICARETNKGKIKFTLIDFGLCQKLPEPGQPLCQNKHFRGNLIYCSDLQLQKY